MASYGLCFILIVQICVVYAQGEIIKSSLTFVIDNTMSMGEEMRSFKEEVSIIFDKVLSSNASQIENLVLVSFNDPGVELRTITKDEYEFKRALVSIRLHSDFNYDCPEKSMTGIELGLTNSLPLSYLYVITDASAKDYEKLEQIKSIAQKKQSQVVFLLTGMCDSNTSDPKYQAYHQLAQASGGQVFHMMKNDVKDIFIYIEESITGRGVSLLNKKYPPGTHNVKFNVDVHTGAVLISLSGLGSRIGQVTGPDGSKPPTEAIVSGKEKMAVRRLNDAKPGDYEVKIEGRGEVHIIMIAKTDLNFQLGFSIDSPTSMKDTVTRPPPGGNAFLGIRLLGEGVELTTAKIIDLDNNVIAELPLTLVDKKEQFYVTPSFDPPYSMFLVTVIGNDLNTETPVVRTGPTPIARQNPLAEPAVMTAPDVTIQGAPKIIVEYDAPLKLKCNVHGYPAPDIVWSEKDTGTLMPAKVHLVDVPYDYVSILDINKANKNVSYECKASNSVDTSIKYVEVETESKIYFDVIEAPKEEPVIDKSHEVQRVIETTNPELSCRILKGTRKPELRCSFNPAGLTTYSVMTETIETVHMNNVRREQTGTYQCSAKNALRSDSFTMELVVEFPVTIEPPMNSNIDTLVGETEILNCRADGFPEPHIKWTFQSSDPKIPAKDITPTGGVMSLALKNLQLDQQGSYTCEAQNGIGGSASITYDVKVYAPPVIVNTYPLKKFVAMIGDVMLIQCNATGSPKPSIVWMKNGLNLDIGSEWYDMEADGTLIIKNIDRDSEGSYVCQAENFLGPVTEQYEVTVRDQLIPAIPRNTIFVKTGETININCDIPHHMTDQMRWFKDSLPITASGTLTLPNVTRSDDGLYTCRVSNSYKSRSVTTKVVVGYKPEFTTKEEEIVEFVHGADAVMLSCEAYGQPRPTTATWKHNGNTLVSTEMSYPLEMVYGATGTYECEVSNAFGSIRRTFKVTSRDCILDIKKDFPQKQPIMFSPSVTWPVFPVNDGYMIIPHRDYFFMHCPSLFSHPALPKFLVVYCAGDNTFKTNGVISNFADITCKEEVKPQVSKTGIPCLPGKTEYVKVGYKVHSEFLEVFEVCLDTKNNVPLFTKHKLSPNHNDRSTEAAWSNSLLPQDFDTLYDCSRQMYDITSTLGRGLSTRDSCCFGKRQLVSSHNLMPGVPTSSAYDYLNVIPHWSTCNSKNWKDVEQSVRKLVKSAGRDLIVSTGTANPRRGGASPDITLHDGRGGKQSVSPYLWKVVQDLAQAASLVIIQINIPELSAAEASKHVLCPDICGAGISWIEPSNWQNVEDGYTYCCSLIEFEKAFDYNGLFSPNMTNVLLDGFGEE